MYNTLAETAGKLKNLVSSLQNKTVGLIYSHGTSPSGRKVEKHFEVFIIGS